MTGFPDCETPADQPSLGERFDQTRAALILAQQALAQWQINTATDPDLERRSAGRGEQLRRERDRLLDQWARQALSWVLQGGVVQLVPAGGSVQAEPVPEPPPPAPDEILVPDEPPVAEHLSLPDRIRAYATRTPLQRAIPKPRPLDCDALADVLRTMGPPPGVLLYLGAAESELGRLALAIRGDALDSWSTFPRHVQKALVGLVVARSRHIQDEIPEDIREEVSVDDLDAIFSSMTGYSKREQPGFVFGLQRNHHPVADTWAADADKWWKELVGHLPQPESVSPEHALAELRLRIDREGTEEEIVEQALKVLDADISPDEPALVRLMTPHLDKLRKHTRFKRLRKAIRDTVAADEEFEEEITSEAPLIPDGWPWRHAVKGRRAAIVGGEFHDEARRMIADAFQFEAVTWSTTARDQDLQEVAEGVREGGLDMVLVLRRFAGSRVDEMLVPVCRDHRVPLVEVEGGYGIGAIKAALEGHLAR